MLDVHIIEKPGWATDRVLEQLRHPLVTAHVVPYSPGNILAARRAGYSQGTSSLVTWVDPDDDVLDLSWLPEAVEWMNDPGVALVFPRWHAAKHTSPVMSPPFNDINRGSYPHAHHLTLMRRHGVEQALTQLEAGKVPMVKLVDVTIVRLQLQFGRALQHPTVAYRWRTGQEGSRAEMGETEAKLINRLRDLPLQARA